LLLGFIWDWNLKHLSEIGEDLVADLEIVRGFREDDGFGGESETWQITRPVVLVVAWVVSFVFP
jgi:hypothetical protein